MADGDVRYELKSVKAMRGTEGRSIAKWQAQGWELVSQDSATLHTTLNFRKVKPPLPMRQIVIGGVVAAVLLGIVGIGAALEGKDGDKQAASTKESPAAVASATPEVTVEPAPEATPSTAATGQPVEPADGPLTDTTVDALLDRLNAGSSGGIKVGDRFRITGELMESRLWFVGATGEYTVMLKAKGGKQDLSVFVDRSLTTGWRDGTRVELVVKAVERTIDGETTDGWLLVKSARTL